MQELTIILLNYQSHQAVRPVDVVQQTAGVCATPLGPSAACSAASAALTANTTGETREPQNNLSAYK